MEEVKKSGEQEISAEQLEEVVGGALSSALISSVKSNSLVLSKSIIATRPVLKGDLVKMTCGSYNI